jgi:hypothetical protein
MMLHAWGEPEAPEDFTWRLEALAYRVKKSGVGILADDRPFTRFDPTEGERNYGDE